MGADINGWVELRRSDGWWEGVVRIRPIVERAYGVFGGLFGIRNDDGFIEAFPGRGIPANASSQVREELGVMRGLDVGDTYATWSEIKDIDWPERGREEVARNVEFKQTDETNDYEYSTWEDEGERWHLRRRLRSGPPNVYEHFYRDKLPPSRSHEVYQVKHWTRIEVLTPGWAALLRFMEDLASLEGGDNVRLVVWFDSE